MNHEHKLFNLHLYNNSTSLTRKSTCFFSFFFFTNCCTVCQIINLTYQVCATMPGIFFFNRIMMKYLIFSGLIGAICYILRMYNPKYIPTNQRRFILEFH